MDLVRKVCESVAREGGRAFVVGGWVRDRLLGLASKDVDMEVYGLEADVLRRTLRTLGRVGTVGESFTVYKLFTTDADGMRFEIDVSLPRRESKSGRGHRGFDVVGDPHMKMEEAARRRDFSINAILYDPLTDTYLDPVDGRADIERRILRAVDSSTFGDDSLRVLRGAQLVARYGLSVEPATEALCRRIPLDDLPAERVWGEMEKLLLVARQPSIGLETLRSFGVLTRLFPELEALEGCPQEPDWHPEGDVWTHTRLVVDEARLVVDKLDRAGRTTVMLAALCHDLGKPATTRLVDGRIRSLGHDRAGLEPTARMLDALNIHTIDGYDARHQVLALVAEHLVPSQLHHDRDRVTDGAFRRLARRVDCRLLYIVARADALGRTGAARNANAQEWFWARIRELELEHGAPPPLLLGRHVLDLGLRPGPAVGLVTKAVYELQLDGTVTTVDEAIEAARRAIADL